MQIGWALDGFPIYGPIGPKNVTMLPCGLKGAHPQLCLDACNGFLGQLPGYDDFAYRYYIPGPLGSGHCSGRINRQGEFLNSQNCSRLTDPCCLSVIPSEELFPYSIGCLRGCTVGQANCQPSVQKGTTASYIPTAINDRVRGVYQSSQFNASGVLIISNTTLNNIVDYNYEEDESVVYDFGGSQCCE